ncbi:MAG: hypothetical protein HY784_07060 [Chloroflexi bacterium]|nr:hypothetical protein [Chloroflexota bacterium]
MSKRQLGILLLILGLLAALAALVPDWLGAGRFAGVGPAERAVILSGLALAAVGASLIPFGDRPA